MKKIDSKFFNEATRTVFLLKVLYFLNIPLSKIFIRFQIRPHIITTLSNISALVSFYFVFTNLYLFVFLWVLALFFDICDGIVARATDQKSAVGSFYDHFTDVIKILVLYALIAVKYDSSEIWMLSTANIIAFSLLGFSNMVLSQRNAILRRETRKEEKGRSKTENVSSGKERLLVFMDKIPFLKNTFLFVYTSIFVMYGNFNLLLIPLAINPLAARITFLVVLVVVIKSLLGIIWSVHKLNIYMDENKISWK